MYCIVFMYKYMGISNFRASDQNTIKLKQSLEKKNLNAICFTLP